MAMFKKSPREMTMAGEAFASSSADGRGLLSRVWTPGARLGWTGYSASALLHLTAMGVAAMIGFGLPDEPDLPAVDSSWHEPDVTSSAIIDVTPFNETTVDPGGRTATGAVALLDAESPTAANPERALQSVHSPLDVQSQEWSAADLLSDVGPAKVSSGQGRGTGDGVGDGDGFFGISPDAGRRIVYVVDNSRSMNHPHDSDAKTRFRRLKVELINSVWHMGPDQEFYIVFFSDDMYPMPATALQPATPSAKQTYLEWVARMDAYGAPTDPRNALELALKLEPDIIYFLTDGEFDRPVNRTLTRIKQHRTTIHTFAFGERFGETVLQEIAKKNQGKYTFVP